MDFDRLVKLAGTWNRDGHVKDNAPKEVTVFDAQDKTACAKLVADWGTDYFQLIKDDGKWKIYHVLWQVPPIDANRNNNEEK